MCEVEKENERLREENAKLKEELARAYRKAECERLYQCFSLLCKDRKYHHG